MTLQPEEDPAQVWDLTVAGVRHRVEVRGSFVRRVRWFVDGECVAEKKSSEDALRLTHPEHGTVGVWHSALGRPRRSTLFRAEHGAPSASARALTGLGGLDLTPEPGSPAAAHEARVRAHPRRYALVQTLGGVAKVVLPLVVALLLARLAFSIDWPDWDLPLPTIPLPSIPWPSVPWPRIDLPEVRVPGWVQWLLEHAKYVVPVLIAFGLAQAEVRRRRTQDELRRRHARDEPDGEDPADDGAP